MKRTILALLLVLLAYTVHAADYYVDATGGDDSYIVTSPSLAWKTVAKVNTINFQPGDTVRFKCGEVWREQLNITYSGTALDPITYTSYGTGCDSTNKPVINAASEINAVWSQYSGNIYVADVDFMTAPLNYISNGSFDIDNSNWFKGPDNYGDVEFAFEAGCIIGNGGCLKYVSSANPSNDNHFNGADYFALDSGKDYNLKFRISAEEGLQIRVKIMESPYQAEDRAYDQTFTMGSTVFDHSETFTPLNTLNNAKILFYVLDTAKTVFLDDVVIASTLGEPATAKQLFINGKYLKLAQYPDTGFAYMDEDSIPGGGTGYGNGTDFLIDYELSTIAGQDLAGAGIHIRSIDWAIEDRVVHTFDEAATKLFWTDDTNYAILTGYGYYVDNKLWMLDSEGEWFYDEINGKMYVWLPGNENPNNAGLTIEASIHDYGIHSLLRSNISIDGIEIKNAALDGLHFTDSLNIQVMNADVSDSGRNGMHFMNSDNGRIEDSTVKNSVSEGIYTKQSTGFIILGNHIEDSGVVGSPRYSNGAITASNDAQVMNNTILNSGYIGITFKKESTIKNNVIKNSCIVLNDCGAIYTWNGNSDPSNPPPYNSEVSGNIVIGSQGGIDGTQKTPRARGIYLDGGSDGITVLNNTVTGATNDGIYFRASNSVIDGNTSYGNGGAQLTMIESMFAADVPVNTSKDNILEHNILFPTRPSDRSLVSLSVSYDFYEPTEKYYYGPFDYNTYSTLYSDIAIYEKYRLNNNDVIELYDLPLWQQVLTYSSGLPYNQDTNSTLFEPFHILPYEITSIDSGNFVTNGSFDTGISNWFEVPRNGADNAQIIHEADCIIGNGGCIKYISSTSANDNHFNNLNLFPLDASKQYRINFNISAEPGLEIGVIIMQWDYDMDDRAYDYTFTTDSTVMNISEMFVPLNTLSNAKVLFYVPSGNKTVFIDDVSVEEVTAVINDPSDDSQILINETDQDNKEFYCPDIEGSIKCSQYIGLDSAAITWPVTLDKFSSKIILWAANPFRDLDNDRLPDPCTDSDGDGYSADGGWCGETDWDDSDNRIYPGAPEIPGDGKDNDQDGLIDEIITWTGTASSDWDTADNWDLDTVPQESDNVIIAIASVDPVLAFDTTVNNLTIESGTLTLNYYNLTVGLNTE